MKWLKICTIPCGSMWNGEATIHQKTDYLGSPHSMWNLRNPHHSMWICTEHQGDSKDLPAIKNAIASINAPQQAGELNVNYHRCCTTATWHHHIMFNKTPLPATFYQLDHTEDMESTRPFAPGTLEVSGPMIQVPWMAWITMASNIEDWMAYRHPALVSYYSNMPQVVSLVVCDEVYSKVSQKVPVVKTLMLL